MTAICHKEYVEQKYALKYTSGKCEPSEVGHEVRCDYELRKYFRNTFPLVYFMQIAASKTQSSIESNINLFHAPPEAKDQTFDRQTFNHMFVFLFSGYL